MVVIEGDNILRGFSEVRPVALNFYLMYEKGLAVLINAVADQIDSVTFDLTTLADSAASTTWALLVRPPRSISIHTPSISTKPPRLGRLPVPVTELPAAPSAPSSPRPDSMWKHPLITP
jgi:hypothetical protein